MLNGKRQFAAIASVAGLVLGTTLQAADPVLSLGRAQLRIQAPATEGMGELIVIATGDDVAGRKDPLTVSDVPPAGAPATGPVVKFGPPTEVIRDPSSRRVWRVPAFIQRMPATASTTMREARIPWGSSVISAVPYQLTNTAAPTVTLKAVGVPTEWRVTDTDEPCHALRIAVSGAHATGVVLTSTLVETTTRDRLDLYLALDGHPAVAAAPDGLEAAINYGGGAVLLCTPISRLKPGKYKGSLNIAADEKPEGDSVETTVYATTLAARLFGAALILIGTIGAFLLRILAPANLARAQALLAAALVRERATALLAKVDALVPQPPLTVTRQKIATMLASLRERQLVDDGLVGGRIPLPFGAGPDTATFKQRVDDSAALVERAAIVIEQGVLRATTLGGSNLATVISELDELLAQSPPPAPAALRASVADIVNTLTRVAGRAAVDPPLNEVASETLAFTIAETSGWVWATWVLLSVVVGFFVLVVNNPGFGVPMDYLTCLIWGVGLPLAGQQLTASSVSTALGVSLPKPS